MVRPERLLRIRSCVLCSSGQCEPRLRIGGLCKRTFSVANLRSRVLFRPRICRQRWIPRTAVVSQGLLASPQPNGLDAIPLSQSCVPDANRSRRREKFSFEVDRAELEYKVCTTQAIVI